MGLIDRYRRRRYFATSGPYSTDAPDPVGGAAGSDESWYMQVMAGGNDPNWELNGRNKFRVYDEMRKTDPAVRSALWLFKLPIRGAQWGVSPASDDPEDRVVAEFVEQSLGLQTGEGWLDLTWDEQLSQALLMLDWGCMFSELVWDDPVTWSYSDDQGAGIERIVRPLIRLAPRFPATIERVRQDPKYGVIGSIEQDLPDTFPIPGDKLMYLCLDREGVDWFGTSLLRPMWGPWKLKKALMVSAGIGWDRFAAGTPKVKYPATGGRDAERKAEEMGKNYRLHERGWIAHSDDPGWDFEIVNGAGSLADPTPLLKHYDEQIAEAALQMFSKLGTTGHGARAVGDVLADPYYLATQALAKQIATTFDRQVIRRLVDVNFGTDVKAPELTVSKIQARSISTLATALSDLSAAGLTFTDRDTQNDVRDLLELEHLPEETAATISDLPPGVGIAPIAAPTEGADLPVGIANP